MPISTGCRRPNERSSTATTSERFSHPTLGRGPSGPGDPASRPTASDPRETGLATALLDRVEPEAVDGTERPGALEPPLGGALGPPGQDRGGEGVGVLAVEADLG